jgi:hypothetical protein
VLLGGFCSEDITPTRRQLLSGWGFDGRCGSDDPPRDQLRARALALADPEGVAVVLVSTDVLAMTAEQVREARRKVADVAPDAVLLVNHSHTHSGPATGALRDGPPDPDYLERLVERVAAAAIGAIDRLAPCSLSIGRGEIDIAVNRRVPTEHGVVFGENEDGRLERDVWVLRVDRIKGEPIACWFSLAAHPIVLGPQNLRISADWPGAAVSAIEQRLQMPAVFAQGCCGDNNPRGVERFADSLDEQESTLTRIAGFVADAVCALWGSATNIQPQAFKTGMTEAVLPTSATGGVSPTLIVQGISITESIWLVALSAEPFAGFAQAVRDMTAPHETIMLGYTNGCFGYLADDAAFRFPSGYDRGYEIEVAPTLYGTDVLAPESVEVSLRAVADVVHHLR